MSPQFRTGLVVGKFAPLHRGHQYLIDEAQRRCDRLIVLSYSKPELPGCGPERRARWLEKLYPKAQRVVLDDARLARLCVEFGHAPITLPANEASDDTHRDFVAWVLRELCGTTVDAVFTSEHYGDGFAAALGRHQPTQPAVTHVEVDRARARFVISGTRVRADPHAHRLLLSPFVYADFVQRVAVLGGESSGKSTLASRLAERLGTVCVPEFGREYWEAVGGRLAFADLLHIARTQCAREDTAAQSACRYLICDTTALTTAFYSEHLFGECDPQLRLLAAREYSHTILCATDIPFVQDGTRQGASFRDVQDQWFRAQLAQRGVAFFTAFGSKDERVSQAIEHLESAALVE
jgi:NadR type nicotinamide-nucleotide adenylyltransferase